MRKTISKRSYKPTTRLLFSAMILLLVTSAPAFSQGGAAEQDHSSHASSQKMKIPQTAKDHHELAERYQQKATEYRGEIDMHKEMLAEYAKGVAQNPKSGENPYIRNMRLHCEKYIKAAENLEQEASEMAKFHTFRARELEGK